MTPTIGAFGRQRGTVERKDFLISLLTASTASGISSRSSSLAASSSLRPSLTSKTERAWRSHRMVSEPCPLRSRILIASRRARRRLRLAFIEADFFAGTRGLGHLFQALPPKKRHPPVPSFATGSTGCVRPHVPISSHKRTVVRLPALYASSGSEKDVRQERPRMRRLRRRSSTGWPRSTIARFFLTRGVITQVDTPSLTGGADRWRALCPDSDLDRSVREPVLTNTDTLLSLSEDLDGRVLSGDRGYAGITREVLRDLIVCFLSTFNGGRAFCSLASPLSL